MRGSSSSLCLLLCREKAWGLRPARSYTNARTIRHRLRKARGNMVQSLESLLHTQKPFRRLWSVKCCLQRHPKQVMRARELERSLESSGLVRKSPILVNLLPKYPAIFRVSQIGGTSMVEFADEAKELLAEEEMVQAWYEPLLVQKLRRLLMMSRNRMLRIDHICLLHQELALPQDACQRFAEVYPQFFDLVEWNGWPYLKLAAWDDSLAVTERERELKEKPLVDRGGTLLPYGFPITLPKGHRLGLKNQQIMNAWQKAPFPSPYEDAEWLSPMSAEVAKQTVATLHEFLSLTVEKRTTVDHLEALRRDLKMPRGLPEFLDRHFGIFYLSHCCGRNHVFLKDAYRRLNSQKIIAYLKEKGPHVLLSEMFCKLMEVRRP